MLRLPEVNLAESDDERTQRPRTSDATSQQTTEEIQRARQTATSATHPAQQVFTETMFTQTDLALCSLCCVQSLKADLRFRRDAHATMHAHTMTPPAPSKPAMLRIAATAGASQWKLRLLLFVCLALCTASVSGAAHFERPCAAPNPFAVARTPSNDQCDAATVAAPSPELPLSRAFPHLHQLLLGSSSPHDPGAAVSIASDSASSSCPSPFSMQLQTLRSGSVVAAPSRFAEATRPRPHPRVESIGPPRFELLERIHVIGSEPGATSTHAYQIGARKDKDERSDIRGNSLDTRREHANDDDAHSSFADSIFSVDPYFHTLLPEWQSDASTGAVAAPPLLTTIHAPSPAAEMSGEAGALDSPSSGSSSPPLPPLDHGEWELRDRVGRGHFGELWRAHRLNAHGAHDSDRSYVLKRLFVEKGYRTRLSGVREVHFGLKIAALPAASRRHLTRLVEWFEDPLDGALWLVFVDEGISLAHYLTHTASPGDGQQGGPSIVTPSEQWTRMKLQMGTPRFERTQAQQPQTEAESSAALQVHTADATDSLGFATTNVAPQVGMFGPFLPSPPPSTISLAECPVDGAPSSAPSLLDADHSSFLPSPGPSVSGRRSRDWLHDDFKSISFQLLQALAVLHEQGITHRDVRETMQTREQAHQRCLKAHCSGSVFDSICCVFQVKPANLLVRPRSSVPRTVRVAARWSSSPRLHVRLCDFGSSLDADPSLAALLYPPPRYSPSRLENTQRYSPPEVLFASSDRVAYSQLHPHAYDLWSAGVTMVEMIVGSADNVFRIDARVKARIEARVEEAAHAERRAQQRARQAAGLDASDEDASSVDSDAAWHQTLARRKEKAVLFRALVEYCIAPDPATDESASRSVESCSDASFQRLLQRSDPLGIGAPSLLSIDLIRRLLQWHPAARGTAAEALAHPYFTQDRPSWADDCRDSDDSDPAEQAQTREREDDDEDL